MPLAANFSRSLFFGVVVGILACLVTWLMTSLSSPLYSYLSANPGMMNFWGKLNFLVFILFLVLDLEDSSAMSYFLVFLQWFVLGFVLSAIINLFRSVGTTHDDPQRLQ